MPLYILICRWYWYGSSGDALRILCTFSEVIAELGEIKIVGNIVGSLEYAFFVVVRSMTELFHSLAKFGVNGDSIFDRKCAENCSLSSVKVSS